jgi:hypothetical protein
MFEDDPDENMRDLLKRVTASMNSGLQATSGGAGDTIRTPESPYGPTDGGDGGSLLNARKGTSPTGPGPGLKPHTEFIGPPTNPDIPTEPMIGGELTDRGDPAREVSRALAIKLAPPSSEGRIPGWGANPPKVTPNLDYDPGFAGPTTTPNIVRPSEALGKPEPGAPSEQDLYYTVHSESQHHGVKNRLKHGLENALLLADPGEHNWKYGLGQLAGNLAAGIISPKSVDKAYEDRVSKPRQQAEIAEADRDTVRQATLRKVAQEEEKRKLDIEGEKRRAQTEGWIQFPDTKTGNYSLYNPATGEQKQTPIKLPPPTAGPRKYLKAADGAQWDVTDPAHPMQILPGKADKPDKPLSPNEAKIAAQAQEEGGIDRAKLHADYAAGRPNRLADILGGKDVFAQLNTDLRSQDEQTKADAARRMAAAQKQFDAEIDADIDNQVQQHVGKRTSDLIGGRGQVPLPAPPGKQTPPAQVKGGTPDPNTYASLLISKMKRDGKTDSDIQAELRRRGLSQ